MSRLPAKKRREQLLDSAAQLFARNGYARATTAELARAAGVTEPIIYRHFASKRDLFVALIERTGHDTLEQWARHLEDASDPAQRLLRLVGDNPMVSERGRDAYMVMLQAISELDDPVIMEAMSRHIQALHAFIADEIEAGQQEHKVTSRFSAEIIAWLLIHLGLGYGVLKGMNIPHQGADRGGVHVRDVISRLLLGRAADEAKRASVGGTGGSPSAENAGGIAGMGSAVGTSGLGEGGLVERGMVEGGVERDDPGQRPAGRAKGGSA